jgi:hypothetical protein
VIENEKKNLELVWYNDYRKWLIWNN